jgi:hypothetical protein
MTIRAGVWASAVVFLSLSRPAVADVILNRASDKALDAVSKDADKNGCQIQLWEYLGSDQKNQNWSIEDLGNGFVKIVNLQNGLVLDAHSNDVKKNGGRVQLWEWKGETQQQWQLDPVIEGGVRIVNRASGKVLDAHSDDVALVHCRVQLWDYKAEPQQVWRIVKEVTPVPHAGTNQRLRMLFVMDTNAEGETIQKGVKANQERFARLMKEITKGREEKFTIDTIEGVKVKPATILKYYDDLELERGDALFIYYAGHGGWDNTKVNKIDEHGHYLNTSGGDLFRSELREAMLRKRPNAVFIITDCCSNIAGVIPPKRREPAEWTGFKKLFFDHVGVYDIQAATRSELGWAGEGGFLFTGVLTKLLCEPSEKLLMDGYAGFEWYAFFQMLRAETVREFKVNQKAADQAGGPRNEPFDIRDSNSQTPQALYLGTTPVVK